MPKNGDRRSDGSIWRSGRWMSPEALQKVRDYEKKRALRRKESGYYSQEYAKNKERRSKYWKDYYEKNKQALISKRVEYGRANPDKTRAAHRREYIRNKSRYLDYNKSKQLLDPIGYLEQKRRSYRNTTPTAGLRDALKQFANGSIGIGELNRKYSEAIEKTDGLIRKALKRK